MVSLDKSINTEYLLSINDQFGDWYIYTSVFSVILVTAIVIHQTLKRKKIYSALKGFDKQLYWFYILTACLGLTSVFLKYEKLPVFGNRLFIFITLGLFVISNAWLLIYYFVSTRKDLDKFRAKARKEKWLKKK